MNPPAPRPPSLAAFLALFLLSAAVFFWMIADFLVAIFMGQVLAFLLGPIYARLRRRVKPGAAAFLAVFALFVGVVAPMTAFGYVVVHDAVRLERTIAESGGLTMGALAARLERLGLGRLGLNPEKAREQATGALASATRAGAKAAAEAARSVPRLIVALGLTLLTAFFLLRDDESLLRLALAPLPLEPEILSEAQLSFHAAAAATVWSSLTVALVQALCVVCAFTATGLREPVLAGGLAFVAAWVPLISSTPIWLAGGVWLIYQGALGRFAVLCVFAAVGYAADHVLRPMMLRGRARLHTLLGLVSVLGGLRAFGLAGVFIGPIVANLLAALYRAWPRMAARYRLPVMPNEEPRRP